MKKVGFSEKALKPVKICGEYDDSPIKIIAAEFAYTEEEIMHLPKFYYRYLCRKGTKKLISSGAEQVFYTRCCETKLGGNVDTDATGRGIPPECFTDAVNFAAEYIGKSALKGCVCIKDRNLSLVSYHMLANICCRVRYIKILTDNITAAEKIAESLCDEYGILPEVLPYTETVPLSAALTADVDNGVIRLGKGIVIDKAEAELDLHGYDVEKKQVLAYIKEKGIKIKYKTLLSGKNRLTR